jgi:hypothetical protein
MCKGDVILINVERNYYMWGMAQSNIEIAAEYTVQRCDL